MKRSFVLLSAFCAQSVFAGVTIDVSTLDKVAYTYTDSKAVVPESSIQVEASKVCQEQLRNLEARANTWGTLRHSPKTRCFYFSTIECENNETSSLSPSGANTIGELGQVESSLEIDIDEYPGGGVAIWYLLPEVLSTVPESSPVKQHEAGHTVYAVHVHARKTKYGKKLVDESFKNVKLFSKKLVVPMELSSRFAQQNFLSSINKPSELDLEKMRIFDELNAEFDRTLVNATKEVSISKKHCPGGYEVFSFNQSILWTAPRPEERGIHVHCYLEDGTMKHDYTFGSVWVEGRKITVDRVRNYAVHKELYRAGLTSEQPDLESIYEPTDSKDNSSCIMM
jgi:hypothetical protein